MKQLPLFTATYAVSMAATVGLAATLVCATYLYANLGIRPQPWIGLICDHKAAFAVLWIVLCGSSTALSLIHCRRCAIAALVTVNLITAIFSVTAGSAFARLFCVIDDLGTAESGPNPGYPFHGFGVIFPICVSGLFIPFHITSRSLLPDLRHDA